MTPRALCDAAFAVIVEEYVRAGMTLQAALDRLAEWAGRVTETVDADLREAEVEVRHRQRVAEQNQAALSAIEGMLART